MLIHLSARNDSSLANDTWKNLWLMARNKCKRALECINNYVYRWKLYDCVHELCYNAPCYNDALSMKLTFVCDMECDMMYSLRHMWCRPNLQVASPSTVDSSTRFPENFHLNHGITATYSLSVGRFVRSQTCELPRFSFAFSDPSPHYLASFGSYPCATRVSSRWCPLCGRENGLRYRSQTET